MIKEEIKENTDYFKKKSNNLGENWEEKNSDLLIDCREKHQKR